MRRSRGALARRSPRAALVLAGGAGAAAGGREGAGGQLGVGEVGFACRLALGSGAGAVAVGGASPVAHRGAADHGEIAGWLGEWEVGRGGSVQRGVGLWLGSRAGEVLRGGGAMWVGFRAVLWARRPAIGVGRRGAVLRRPRLLEDGRARAGGLIKPAGGQSGGGRRPGMWAAAEGRALGPGAAVGEVRWHVAGYRTPTPHPAATRPGGGSGGTFGIRSPQNVRFR